VGGLTAYALVGAGYVFVTFSNLVVGRRIPEESRPSVFAVLQASVFVATSSGSLLVGGLAELVGVRVASASAMVIGATGVALAVFPWMRSRHRDREEDRGS
jgi:MFS family permease